MANIHVLEPHVAELIAAGEVVERPASAAKELLENSIDAGATQITLSILHGGIAQIEVSDNGSGIDCDDLDKAFVRHATSKIQNEDDLNRIHTLGFRGEALASIASVSSVDVLTHYKDDENAYRFHIDGAGQQTLQMGARAVGTTITVNELFYNTPARMKFLKKDVSEGTFVADVVLHAALSHPEISFTFLRDGKQQFTTPGDGELVSAICATLGRDFSKSVLSIQGENGPYRVSGVVTLPRACRASRSAQYFYVNGRYVKNRTMMAALENAFKGTLMQGRFPGCVMFLEMPPELVDVNVHPAKTEVRFAKEGDVFDVVYRAVKQVLTRPGTGERRFSFGVTTEQEPAEQENGLSASGKEYSFTESKTPEPPAQAVPNSAAQPEKKQETPEPKPMVRSLTSPEFREKLGMPPLDKTTQSVVLADPRWSAEDEETWRQFVGDIPTISEVEPLGAHSPMGGKLADASERDLTIYPEAPGEGSGSRAQQLSMEPEPEEEPLAYIGEVFKTYIITEHGNELCLIDKHAAHERILYEKLAKDYGHVPGQLLMVPVQVNLAGDEKHAIMQHLDLLRDAGVEVEDFGGNAVIVRTVPADVAVDSVEDMIVELALKLVRGSKDAISQKTEWVLHSMSCRAAIKAGDKSSSQELMHLAQDIMSGKVPPFCPHGRPVVLKLTRKELEKQFGRLI